ncbi:hypothetical protein [Phenylobacterium sp.]|uniref:hypothetical protein n=1 Tax=Phenylobacterium sp. TaxID=1871053 RepID=UPI002736C7ED|nr:hypothetical protein [Phenylobacterium sp.]MDP3660145.1 hypothetical protein [Phenylobacterium sp.]
MTPDPDAHSPLEAVLDEEVSREAVRREIHARDARRYSGVAWAAMSPDPWPERPVERLRADAASRLNERAAWRASAEGRLVEAVDQAQQAAVSAHLSADAVRACVSRGLSGELDHCAAAAAALERHARRLLVTARAVRRRLTLAAPRPTTGSSDPGSSAR